MSLLVSSPAGDGFDPSQFKLQFDGTFRISIRGMATMAGVDHAGILRSLKSAGDENPLPCARSLVAQGFDPGDVSTWSETGGIPEDAAPFILEHYGIAAASPSPQARAVLLAFTRVGINAYLKEKLGVSQVRDTQPNLALRNMRESAEILQMLKIELDDRDKLHIKQLCIYQNALPAAIDVPISYAIEELGLCHKPLPLANLKQIGVVLKRWFKQERGQDPIKHDQYVDGAIRKVNTYPRDWIMGTLPLVAKAHPELFFAGA